MCPFRRFVAFSSASWLPVFCGVLCLVASDHTFLHRKDSRPLPLRHLERRSPVDSVHLASARFQLRFRDVSVANMATKVVSCDRRLTLRGGMDEERDIAREEAATFEGEMEVEAEWSNEGTATEECEEEEVQNASNVIFPLCHLTDSSDDKTDEDGMPFNTNFGNRSRGDGVNATGPRGCRHYSRGCMIVAPCCNRRFWCRHCHNEEMDVNCRDPKKAHRLDRFTVEQVVCSACETQQPVQASCQNCFQSFGAYFCGVCKFFDDDLSKGQFHCDGCGICRIGGRDNFFHCANCGCCYAMQLRDNHRCIAGAMHHNCPVCLEDLFHSTSQSRVLPCGHTMHKKCLEQLLDRDTPVHVCPLCKRTLVDYSLTWKQLDLAVQCTPLPAELANRTAEILCNDCHAKGQVPFHVYGLKCPNSACGSYNTREIQAREIDAFVPEDEEAEAGAGKEDGGPVAVDAPEEAQRESELPAPSPDPPPDKG